VRLDRAYLEDVEVGQVVETPALTVTEAHVQIFEGLTREWPAEGGAVPDLLPLCLVIGLGWRAPHPPLVVRAFMGVEWEVVRPLRVGETIHSRARIVTKRGLREGGVVIEEREVLDHRGGLVQRGRLRFLVARRSEG
jgi:acyl dehydratase